MADGAALGSNGDLKRRLLEEEDFVFAKRFGNSLKAVRKKYPDGVPDRAAAQMLLISEEELETAYQEILRKMRAHMGVRDTDMK